MTRLLLQIFRSRMKTEVNFIPHIANIVFSYDLGVVHCTQKCVDFKVQKQMYILKTFSPISVQYLFFIEDEIFCNIPPVNLQGGYNGITMF